MTKKLLTQLVIVILAFLSITWFWLFSRFTVDDAFISWRYGLNLVEHGVWNYNPTSFDPTQAYTNPIFAILSIIPAFFGWNMVFFFKIFAMLTVVAFGYWFLKKTNNSWLWLLGFMAIPPFMIHAFSGLETFVWASLVAVLALQLYEHRLAPAVVTTILLFLTRPEAWTLLAIVPAYFFFGAGQKLSFKKIDFKAAFASGIPLAIFMGGYFAFHLAVFGELLPNTFFVKAGQEFSLAKLAFFGFFALPLLLFFLAKQYRLGVALSLLFAPIVLNEAASSLIVNYQARYAFHIFAPIFIILVVLAKRKALGNFRLASQVTAVVVLAAFQLSAYQGTLDLVTSNPRLQEAHIKLGETLKQLNSEGKIRNFAFGDAGATAFYSGLPNLDNIGLGSRLYTKNGLTDELFRQYQVDVTVLHATRDSIRLDEFNLDRMLEWSKANNLVENCDVYFRPNYLLKLYARTQIPALQRLCASSKAANDVSEIELAKLTALNAPWQYWK